MATRTEDWEWVLQRNLIVAVRLTPSNPGGERGVRRATQKPLCSGVISRSLVEITLVTSIKPQASIKPLLKEDRGSQIEKVLLSVGRMKEDKKFKIPKNT